MNRQITTANVKSMRTLNSTNGIKPKRQILKLGEVQMPRNEDMNTNDRGFAIKGNPFLWLIALERFLHTPCKAGPYMVGDPKDNRPPDIRAASPQVLNIERSYIEEHIAFCLNFIVEWTTKNNGLSHHTVLTQVSRIGIAIRSKWTNMYRTSMPAGITFTNRIRNTEANAESLWAADLTRDMSSATSPTPNLRERREKMVNAVAKKTKPRMAGAAKAKAQVRERKVPRTGPQTPGPRTSHCVIPFPSTGKRSTC